MENTSALIALNSMPLIGPRSIIKLLAHWPHLNDCFSATAADLRAAGLTQPQIATLMQFDWKTIETDLTFANTPHHAILTWADPRYPALLKEIDDAPPVLYAIGDLDCLQDPMLAIVGSRRPSPMGRDMAYQWAAQLTQTPLTIVSGLALGIDGAAHLGCLSQQGRTIAVLGTGIHCIYPRTHQALAEKIPQRGLLLSEFSLNIPAKAGHFPRRNRIISGLSLATLVMEATLKSGSLITARFALEQNRDVLALPGSIHLPQAQGCHHLLKQGATLVTSYQDVLDTLGLLRQSMPLQQADSCLFSPSDKVLRCIGFEPTSVDTILKRSGLTVAQVVSRLTQLELHGVICVTTGGYSRSTASPHPQEVS